MNFLYGLTSLAASGENDGEEKKVSSTMCGRLKNNIDCFSKIIKTFSELTNEEKKILLLLEN